MSHRLPGREFIPGIVILAWLVLHFYVFQRSSAYIEKRMPRTYVGCDKEPKVKKKELYFLEVAEEWVV